jgi:uncharacterized protein (TIGR00266 family)
MHAEILARPSASVAKLTLDAGERVVCEVGAMITMSTGFLVETTARQKGKSGGLLGGVKRMLSGENFFLNQFTAQKPAQSLVLGPGIAGDVVHHKLAAGSLIVQGSSWLASGPGVALDATFQGFGSALFSGEGVFWVKCTGQGDVFLNSFGAIYEVDVDGTHIVDSGHIVAFEDTLQFKVGKAGGSWMQSFLSGEGLVCHFSGQGKLYCQSHNPPSFGKLLGPKLKARA